MKHLTTTLALLISFMGISQDVMSWDQRYEKAKYEQREGVSETYISDVVLTGSSFTMVQFNTVKDYLAENSYIFKVELIKDSGELRFYHKSNSDGDYMIQVTREALGELNLKLGEMAPFLFD